MSITGKEKITACVQDFRLPRYEEIPNVGLYLEQVTKYVSECLAPIQEGCITRSMISNYVKQHLIDSPVKKQYSRDQIAYLIFIAVAKSVLSLDNLKQFIKLQKQSYTVQRAYDYFCRELENILQTVFSLNEIPEEIGEESSDEKVMLRSAIIAISYKIFLDKCFEVMAEEKTKSDAGAEEDTMSE